MHSDQNLWILRIGAVIVFTMLIVGLKLFFRFQRRKILVAKYGAEHAERIIAGQVWNGMTAEQLKECLGGPLSFDEQFLKTKHKQTWKYVKTGKNRYKIHIYLEDGVVTGLRH